MKRYGSQTQVDESRSRTVIETMLRVDFGATSCASGYNQEEGVEYAFVTFKLYGRLVRIEARMPTMNEVSATPKGRRRSSAMSLKELAQARRQRWRMLWLVIRAKLEWAAGGLTEEERAETFRQEFFGSTVTPSGHTLFQIMDSRLEEAYRNNSMPSLSLPARGESSFQ